MRFLKQRREVHDVSSQPRAHRLTVIRWLYLASVLALAVWLVNLFFGGLLYLQSEGLVLGDPGTVSAEFPVTVRDVLVQEGDVVEKGQIAVQVTSQSVTETIARLTAESRRAKPDGANCVSAARWSMHCSVSRRTVRRSPKMHYKSWKHSSRANSSH